MNKPLKTLCILMLVLITLPVVAAEKFQDFQGNPKGIADYIGKGKWLVVMLWASDCHVCNQEAHQYIKFHQDHMDKDAQVLGISLDGAAKKNDAREFLKRHQVNFPSLIGEPVQVASMYQELTGDTWIGTPSFMVYTPKGELLGAQAGAVPVSVIESFIERESAATQPKS
ncbi:TlpA family protein disulfide reductase [Kaarinaea lacus]